MFWFLFTKIELSIVKGLVFNCVTLIEEGFCGLSFSSVFELFEYDKNGVLLLLPYVDFFFGSYKYY